MLIGGVTATKPINEINSAPEAKRSYFYTRPRGPFTRTAVAIGAQRPEYGRSLLIVANVDLCYR
jgi:hypothetical protein